MSDSKNETAWRRLFEKYPIDDIIRREGQYVVRSAEINEFREARLMTKFDHRFQLPRVLAERELSILPVSRGSYILSNIETFADFAETPDLGVTEFSIPAHIESLDFSTITSEALAVNCAYVTGILADFTQDEGLMPTVSGRMSSRSFDFDIRRTAGLEGYLHVDVGNAQVEIDGGYEGAASLNLIEAKNSLSSDFLIRQLYYPFRLWHGQVRKTVRPVFLTYTNGIFHLREYAFAELSNYNSLVLVREKKYRLRDAPGGDTLDMETLRSMLHGLPVVGEPGGVPFPQADSFERIVNFCELLYNNAGERYTKEALSYNYDFKEREAFDMRQVDYYTNAAIYLGLVRKAGRPGETTFELTPEGEAVFKTSSITGRQWKFIKAILSHRVFRRTLELYLRKNAEPTKDEIVQIMKGAGLALSESTFRRRASTVLSWVNWILGTVNAA